MAQASCDCPHPEGYYFQSSEGQKMFCCEDVDCLQAEQENFQVFDRGYNSESVAEMEDGGGYKDLTNPFPSSLSPLSQSVFPSLDNFLNASAPVPSHTHEHGSAAYCCHWGFCFKTFDAFNDLVNHVNEEHLNPVGGSRAVADSSGDAADCNAKELTCQDVLGNSNLVNASLDMGDALNHPILDPLGSSLHSVAQTSNISNHLPFSDLQSHSQHTHFPTAPNFVQCQWDSIHSVSVSHPKPNQLPFPNICNQSHNHNSNQLINQQLGPTEKSLLLQHLVEDHLKVNLGQLDLLQLAAIPFLGNNGDLGSDNVQTQETSAVIVHQEPTASETSSQHHAHALSSVSESTPADPGAHLRVSKRRPPRKKHPESKKTVRKDDEKPTPPAEAQSHMSGLADVKPQAAISSSNDSTSPSSTATSTPPYQSLLSSSSLIRSTTPASTVSLSSPPPLPPTASTAPITASTSASPPQHHCHWSNCRISFHDTVSLMSHLSLDHVGSGKKEYFCEWEGCERNPNCVCQDDEDGEKKGKAFKQRQKLMRHLQGHAGDKPFVCQICSKGLRRKSLCSSIQEPTLMKNHTSVITKDVKNLSLPHQL